MARKQRAKYTEPELMEIMSKLFNYCWQDKENYAQRYGHAWRYYRGMEPRDANNTGVEPARVVREEVEENLQVFKTLFNDSTSSVVNVRSNNMDAATAKKISTELNVVAMNLNQISRKMEGWMKETLLTGNGHMKVYLVDNVLDERSHEFEDKTQEWIDSFQKTLQSRGFNEITVDIDDKKTKTKRTSKDERDESSRYGYSAPKSYKLFTGTIKAIAREIIPTIDYIPFEQVYIHPLTMFSLDDAPYFCHSYPMSINEGLRNGWNHDVMLTGCSFYETDPDYATTGLIVGQQYNPFDVDGAGITPVADNDVFQVYEHYWRGTYRGSMPKLWKIVSTKTQLLQEPEEIEEIPFVSARVMEIPNSFYGEGIYDTTAVLQDNKTRELRMLTYTAQNNAYGRMWGVRDGYDKESLLDMRPGGIIDVEHPDAIGLLPTADISQAMKLLMDDTNERIQARIKGAGSLTDDAAKMAETSGIAVSMLIDKSEQGVKARASTFAETGLIPLYHKLYRLLQLINHPVESVAPGVTMSDFPKDLGLTFDVSTLTDKQQDATNVLTALQTIQQLNGGTLPKWVGDEGLYHASVDYLQAGTGNEDVSAYVTDPKTMKPSKAQLYAEAVAYEAKINITKAQAANAELENAKLLSETRQNDAHAALYASQVTQASAMNELKMNNMILQNAKLAAEVAQTSQDTELEPIRLKAELTEVQSGIIAEQANIANGDYAQEANANVN